MHPSRATVGYVVHSPPSHSAAHFCFSGIAPRGVTRRTPPPNYPIFSVLSVRGRALSRSFIVVSVRACYVPTVEYVGWHASAT